MFSEITCILFNNFITLYSSFFYPCPSRTFGIPTKLFLVCVTLKTAGSLGTLPSFLIILSIFWTAKLAF